MAPQRILVRAPQWLGDAVVSTVFIKRLKARYPHAQIIVACTNALTSLFSTHPDVSEIVTLPYPTGNVFEAARRLQQKNCDTAYVLPRSFRAALESRLAKIPARIGYAGDVRRFLLTSVHQYNDQLLYAHRYLKLIGEENFPLEQAQPYFPSGKPNLEKLGFESLQPGKPLLGLAPISVAPARTWRPERFAETANTFLKKNGGTVVLFGSPSERERINSIAASINAGPVINTAGKLSLPELGWFVSQCTAMLANDSGLMHVAACFKVPTVVLFGASDPAFALPRWGRFLALQHKEIFCVPCLKNHCVRLGAAHNECLEAITVTEASEALITHAEQP